MCVEFLTNSLPFADPTFLWNHHRNNSEKYHKFFVKHNKQKGEKGLFYPSKFELVQSFMVSLFPFIFRNLSQLSQPL